MFSWPLPELTKYEERFVSLYRCPVLDAQGRPTGKSKPGVLKRVYEVQLYNQNVPTIPRLNDGPKFEQPLNISRYARVFAFTFQGDIGSWMLEIFTASGEKYTNGPCLVSSMCGGTNYDGNGAFIGEAFTVGAVGDNTAAQNEHSFGVLIDPNYQLLPNESLIFKGALASAVDPDSRRVLSIGVHVWEFPGMNYSTESQGQAG